MSAEVHTPTTDNTQPCGSFLLCAVCLSLSKRPFEFVHLPATVLFLLTNFILGYKAHILGDSLNRVSSLASV